MSPGPARTLPAMAGRWAAAAIAAMTVMGGCGGDDEPGPVGGATPAATPAAVAEATPEARPVPSAEPSPPPPEPPRARRVTLTAPDGERAAAQFTPAGRRAPAIVLLHEIRGGPDQWDGLVPDLHEAGFATLAYKSRASPLEAERMPDVVAALDWLRAHPRQVDRSRIGLVGASIGASTTVLAMATDARKAADAAVALSPPDSSDIWALQDDGSYRPHDVLFIADVREVASAQDMMDGAVRSEVMTSEQPGHGVALLSEPGVRAVLLDWLRDRVT